MQTDPNSARAAVARCIEIARAMAPEGEMLSIRRDLLERIRTDLSPDEDEGLMREALKRLLRHFNERGLHVSLLDGTQPSDVEFARAALQGEGK